jgi:hypothetical protein
MGKIVFDIKCTVCYASGQTAKWDQPYPFAMFLFAAPPDCLSRSKQNRAFHNTETQRSGKVSIDPAVERWSGYHGGASDLSLPCHASLPAMFAASQPTVDHMWMLKQGSHLSCRSSSLCGQMMFVSTKA